MYIVKSPEILNLKFIDKISEFKLILRIKSFILADTL